MKPSYLLFLVLFFCFLDTTSAFHNIPQEILNDGTNWLFELTKSRLDMKIDKKGILPNTQTCEEWLDDLSQKIHNKLSNFTNDFTQSDSAFLNLSGFFPKYIGKFNACKIAPSMDFYHVSFSQFPFVPLPFPESMLGSGLCLPNQCNPDHINDM